MAAEACALDPPEHVGEIEVALTGRPGPVQVAVAWNITAPSLQVTNYSPPQIDRRPLAPKPAEIETLAERWRPYCSVATWYLWRSLDGKAEL